MIPSPAKRYTRIIFNYLVRFDWLLLMVFLAITLLRVWPTRYVPSLDGPQHLYNANVTRQLVTGDPLFREFFRINPVIVGYWTGHFLLGLFRLLLPAWLAEKFFLTVYILGMFFSFRYLVRSITKIKENLLVYLIFPFIFHTYLLLGYYTFAFAAIFFFWAFGYYIRVGDHLGWKEMVLFGLLILGIFLSHALVFLFFAASFFLYYLARILYGKVVLRSGTTWKETLIQTAKLVASVLPALILWILYIRSVMELNNTVTPAPYSASDLVRELLRIRQLVGFNHEVESPPYVALFINLVILSGWGIIQYIGKRQKGKGHWLELADPSHSWAAVALLFLLAYFLLPDRVSAGSLTHRFGVFFFFSWIVLLATLPTPRWLQMVTLILLISVMGFTRKNQRHFLENLNDDIADIQEMSPAMEDGSTVISFSASPNWIHTHFSLYTAVDKKLVHLNNPQCAGQFPVIWNEKRIPLCYTGTRLYRPGGSPVLSGEDRREFQVDYITLFHYKTFWADSTRSDWHRILSEDYELVMTTSRDLGALYRSRRRQVE